jgi:predicted glycosyltransferase
MKILFDICHPAHVHLFKNLIFARKKEGIQDVVVSRDKDLTIQLLNIYGIEHTVISTAADNGLNRCFEFIKRTSAILRLHKKHNFTHAVGTSVSIGFLSLLKGVKSYNFNEDDDKTTPLFCNLAYPFSTKICIPSCLRYTKWKKKRILHDSYHELAYLHPDNFIPDSSVPEKYGLKKGEYGVVRFSALKAHHDYKARGISETLWEEIKENLGELKTVLSKEGESQEIKPEDMHHLLSFAKIVITDSQTMSIESAVLGVPVFRINTFIGKSSVLSEIENKYELAKGFLPSQKQEILNALKKTLNNPDLEKEMKGNRENLLNEKIDLNKWMKDLVDTF